MSVGRSEIVGPMPRYGRPGPSRVLTDATHSAARRHSGRRDGSSRFTSSAAPAVTRVSLRDAVGDGCAGELPIGKRFVKRSNAAGQEASAVG